MAITRNKIVVIFNVFIGLIVLSIIIFEIDLRRNLIQIEHTLKVENQIPVKKDPVKKSQSDNKVIDVPPDFLTGISLNNLVWKIWTSGNKSIITNFYEKYTKNVNIIDAIVEYSYAFKVPINLAFGVAYKESRFNPYAVSPLPNSNGSKDWGLFSLNDRVHPQWTTSDFFNVYKNTAEAMKYLSQALNHYDGKVIIALGAYNAGIRGIKAGANFTTLDYIDSILEFRDRANLRINNYLKRTNFSKSSKNGK